MPQNDQKPSTLLEWLALKRWSEIVQSRALGGFLGFLLTAIAALLIIAFFLTIFDFIRALLRAGPYAEDVTGESIRNIGALLVALLGGPFLVWRSHVAAKQANTQVEALFNDKINAAATDLAARRQVTRVIGEGCDQQVLTEWEDDVGKRVAALHRLEVLNKDNQTQTHILIMDLLSSYLRNHAALDRNNDGPADRDELISWINSYPPPRADIQAAVSAIGRRTAAQVNLEIAGNYQLNLRATNLRKVSLRGANLSNADFTAARFDLADIRGADFSRSRLRHARLRCVMAVKCNFSNCDLQESLISDGLFSGAFFDNSDLFNADARGAEVIASAGYDVGRSTFIGANLADANFDQTGNLHGFEFLDGREILQIEEAAIFELAFTSEQTVLLLPSFVDRPSFNFKNLRRPSLYEHDASAEWRRWRKVRGLN